MKYCLLIPHYNHQVAFASFLPQLVALKIPVIVIDDGSDKASIEALCKLLDGKPNFTLLRHKHNRGKGAAFISGCYQARAMGFTHVIQIDADGQHDTADIQHFIAHSREHPAQIVSGRPHFEKSAPKARVYGRRFTDIWTALETLSFQIKDALCGFRVYPLTQVERIVDRFHVGARMDFDTDILVKAVWLGIPLHFIPTQVKYHADGVSHFHYLRDNILLVRLHIRLIFGMLILSPYIIHNRIINSHTGL